MSRIRHTHNQHKQMKAIRKLGLGFFTAVLWAESGNLSKA